MYPGPSILGFDLFAETWKGQNFALCPIFLHLWHRWFRKLSISIGNSLQKVLDLISGNFNNKLSPAVLVECWLIKEHATPVVLRS